MLYDFGTSHLLPAAARFGLLLLLPFSTPITEQFVSGAHKPFILSGMSIEERHDLGVT